MDEFTQLFKSDINFNDLSLHVVSNCCELCEDGRRKEQHTLTRLKVLLLLCKWLPYHNHELKVRVYPPFLLPRRVHIAVRRYNVQHKCLARTFGEGENLRKRGETEKTKTARKDVSV